MTPSSSNRVVVPRNRIQFRRKPVQKHWILVGSIAPVGLAMGIFTYAADKLVPPDFSINSDVGAPVFAEGLREGFVDGARNLTTPNSFNSSPELTLRMGQSTATGADAWANNRTWVYTGQIFTGPNGIISLAANNDDADWFKINGAVVLDDGTWTSTNTALVTGLTPNSWVDFEYRVGNGTGGAGPSGVNVGANNGNGINWNATTGVVMSYVDETDVNTGGLSLDANAYDLGRPTEPAGGGPTLFRYQTGLGFDDDLRVTASGTITLDGGTALVSETSLKFENTAASTLTVNDGTGVHKVLAFTNGTTIATAIPATVSGTSDVRVGKVTDGATTGAHFIAGGAGRHAGSPDAASIIVNIGSPRY